MTDERDRGGTLVDSSSDDEPAPAAGPVPPRLGRYRVLGRVGEGGMGEVYRARDPELGRDVAIKLVRRDRVHSEAVRDRLVREARALAQVSHANVVPVFDVGTVDGDVFVAMELIDGVTVADWLAAEPRGRDEIVRVLLAAGAGLAAAHRAGLVHRDFKPANVIIGRDGAVKVLDFGLARAARAPHDGAAEPIAALDPAMTRTGAVVGTPAYMAPEQLEGEPADARADQFAICVALYEALCGERPFGGDTLPELIERVAGRAPDAALSFPASADLPAHLRRALERGLHVEPDHRFPDMDALLAALARDPARARRRRAVAAIAAVAVAGAAVAITLVVTAAGPACVFGAELPGVWDGRARAAGRAAFEASGAPEAAAAWARVEGVVDDYAAALVAMRADNCAATRVRGEQTAELMDLRTACLAERERELGALARVFAGADAATVGGSIDAAYALTPLDGCRRAGSLRAVAPRPPQRAAELAALDAELAEIKVLIDTGRYAAALPRATAAVEQARAIAYPPALARALHLLGDARDHTDDPNGAVAAYREAAAAADAGRDDEHRFRAYLALVYVEGYRLEHDELARGYDDQATAVLARIEGGELLAADLYFHRAVNDWWHGRAASAEQHARRAIELRERLLGPDHPDTGRAHNVLAITLMVLERQDEALAEYQIALRVEEAALGHYHPRVAARYDNLSTAYMDLRRYPEAERAQRTALEIFERTTGADSSEAAITWFNLGNALRQQGRYADALAAYDRSVAITEARLSPDDSRVADALDNRAVALARLGRHDEAIATSQRAVDIHAVRLGDDHPVTATSRRILGGIHADRGDHEAALALYERAVLGIERTQGPDSTHLLPNLTATGGALVRLRRWQRARAVLERVDALYRAHPTAGTARDRAVADMYLATALIHTRGDRADAVARARAARDRFAAAGDEAGVAEADAWLAENAVP